jgi:hypothetical protein
MIYCIYSGKISPWLDLDSEDETTRMEAETILRKQIEWASYLSIKVSWRNQFVVNFIFVLDTMWKE